MRLVVKVEETFGYGTKYFFPHHTLFHFICNPSPSKLGRQSCRVTCLLTCVSARNKICKVDFPLVSSFLHDKYILKQKEGAVHKDAWIFLSTMLAIPGPMIYAAPSYVMLLMRATPLRGQVGWGLALEIENFLCPVKWHQAVRRMIVRAVFFIPYSVLCMLYVVSFHVHGLCSSCIGIEKGSSSKMLLYPLASDL